MSALHEQVAQIIERFRPAIQEDGGDIELITVTDDGVVQVRLLGACVNCPSSHITLKSGIERTLKERVEGIREVQQVQ